MTDSHNVGYRRPIKRGGAWGLLAVLALTMLSSACVTHHVVERDDPTGRLYVQKSTWYLLFTVEKPLRCTERPESASVSCEEVRFSDGGRKPAKATGSATGDTAVEPIEQVPPSSQVLGCRAAPLEKCDNTDLAGGDFSNLDLSNADFSGSDLEGATFRSATLRGASFQNTNISGADFTGADLEGATMTGARRVDVVWGDTVCPDGTNSASVGRTCGAHLKPSNP